VFENVSMYPIHIMVGPGTLYISQVWHATCISEYFNFLQICSGDVILWINFHGKHLASMVQRVQLPVLILFTFMSMLVLEIIFITISLRMIPYHFKCV
jgi:hypothetical protein